MFDNAELSVPCSHCGQKTTQTVAWLKTRQRFSCACGAHTEIDARQFVEDLQKLNHAVEDLKRSQASPLLGGGLPPL
jgi:lysyl-tRNA synthetase class I